VDKAILGGRREEVLLVVKVIIVLEGSDVSKELKIVGQGGRGRGAGDNIIGGGGVVGVIAGGKSRPNGGCGWGGGERLGDGRDEYRGVEVEILLDWGRGARGYKDGQGGAIYVLAGGREIPSVEVTVQYLKDGGGGIGEVLLVDVVNGRPGGDGDLEESGGGDDGGFRRSKRHLKQLASLWRLF